MREVIAILVCILILVLAWFCSRFLGKTWNRKQKGKYMEVIDQTVIGQDRSLLILRVQERYFLLGSASGKVSLIAELGDFSEEEDNSSGGTDGPPDFKSAFLYNLKKYTGITGGKKDN